MASTSDSSFAASRRTTQATKPSRANLRAMAPPSASPAPTINATFLATGYLPMSSGVWIGLASERLATRTAPTDIALIAATKLLGYFNHTFQAKVSVPKQARGLGEKQNRPNRT